MDPRVEREKTSSLVIDGSQGEGGGQILRSALSLSMLTGRAFSLRNIRAGRRKPGLMRQHLVCVEAARTLSRAAVTGAELGSSELHFIPGEIAAGNYRFDIGSAGSTMLVLQTILPAMLQMTEPCRVSISGGTHNPLAPSADFFSACFLPQLHAMGANVALAVEAIGLYPAGLGRVTLATEPLSVGTHFVPISLLQRCGTGRINAHAIVAGVPEHVAERELAWLRENYVAGKPKHALPIASMRSTQANHTGPGNVLCAGLSFDNVCEQVTEFGSRGTSAEDVAKAARDGLARYLRSGAVVGEHLADQLLLPMLLAGGGEFICAEPSLHLRTNADVIEAFGVAKISIEPAEIFVENAPALWRVAVGRIALQT